MAEPLPPFSTRHSLFHLEQPIQFLRRTFRVYPGEVKLLVWVTIIQMIMRVSSILMSNFAQTAFLKRYGVEALPTVFVLEAVLTLFFASAVGLLMDRHRTTRVFTGLFLFFAVSIAIIRGLLPLGHPIVYPILYILKSQAVEILPILYWDILSDMFTTQQSKRLYTLITAGGVLGTTLGSLLTGAVATWVGADNVLVIFSCGMCLAALLNEFTERIVGAPLEPRTDRRKKSKGGAFRENVRDVMGYAKRSPLLVYMILIIAIPNMLLPIITYQFNVVVDAYYGTERETLQFFGIFRGISNAAMFILLLFSGRFITRFGIPTSLLFHPINYLIAFSALFLRFDIFSGTVARFTTETLKTTLNNPARAILYNFFPEHMRGLIRVFLRGTVVRVSDFAGSGVLMLIRGLMDPRLLSLVAAPLALVWIATSFRLKRHYSSMLIQTLKEKQMDVGQMEEVDFRAFVQDRPTLDRLQQELRGQDPKLAVACAEILSQGRPPGWARTIAEALPHKTPGVQKQFLDLLVPEHASEVMNTLTGTALQFSTESLVYLLPAMGRLDLKTALPLARNMFQHPDPRVCAEALTLLSASEAPGDRLLFRRQVEALLSQGTWGLRIASRALGKTADPHFAPVLLSWAKGDETEFRAHGLSGLAKLHHPEALELARRAIADKPAPRSIRTAALEVLASQWDRVPAGDLIPFLDDPDPAIRNRAGSGLMARGDAVVQSLLPALASPSERLRTAILSILDQLGAPGPELSQFILDQLALAYRDLHRVYALRPLETGDAPRILSEYLSQRIQETLELILRVLGILEFGDRIKVILRAIHSGNRRDMDNAIEAVESSLHIKIRRLLVPLLENRPMEEKLAAGKRWAGPHLLLSTSPRTALAELAEDSDPFVQTLVLYAMRSHAEIPEALLSQHRTSPHPMVREAARWASGEYARPVAAKEQLAESPDLIVRIGCVRQIPLFSDLPTRELMAVAAIALTRQCRENEVVVREGDSGEGLYLVLQGKLAVIKAASTPGEITLDHIGDGGFFGEMALIDGQPRSATVRSETSSLLLRIPGEEFERIMRTFPAVPINICRVFIRRIQELHSHIQPPSGRTDETPT